MKSNVSTFYMEYLGHVETFARQVTTIKNDHLKTIIGVGGDGTIYEIVNGLSFLNNIRICFQRAGSG